MKHDLYFLAWLVNFRKKIMKICMYMRYREMFLNFKREPVRTTLAGYVFRGFLLHV
mgnify:CR=1 FL=1